MLIKSSEPRTALKKTINPPSDDFSQKVECCAFKKTVLQETFAVLICLLLFIMSVPVYAAPVAPVRQTVRVGYFQCDGFNNCSDSGVRSGYGYDILQKLRVYENWNYEYIGFDNSVSWQDMLKLLENGEIDLLAPASLTKERNKKFAYSSLPMGSSLTVLSVKSNNRKYSTADYSNWNNISVGMIASNSKNASFHDYAQKHGFTYKSVICKSTDELAEKLKSGEVDITVTDSLFKLADVWVLDEFDRLDVYYIVNRKNTALLNQLNDGLSKLLEAEPNYQDKLYQKYYGNSGGRTVQFSDAEQAYIDASIENKRVYYAVINPDRKPLSYCENNQMKGLLTDICMEIFSRTGLDIRLAVLDSRENYYKTIKDKSADVICDYTGSFSRAENNNLVMLDSYYKSTVSRLARRDSDRTGNRCAVAGKSISSWLQGKGYDFIYVDTLDDCCKAVQNGTADFTFSYTKCIQEMVYDDMTNSLMALSESYRSTNFGIAVANRHDALLCSILQKSIDSVISNGITNIADAYTYYDKKNTSLKSIIYRNPIAFGAFVFLFAVLLFGIIILFLVLRRKSAEAKNAVMLKQALHTSEIATKEKNDFYARMSHDMRTPMSGILGVSNLSMEETDPRVLQENMRKIHDSGEYLLGLINDTLDLQRIESGKLTLESKFVLTKDFIASVTAAVMQIAKEKGVKFRIVNTNMDSNHYIRIDPMRIKQIFINLLSNAVKFTPAGGTVELTLAVLGRDGNMTHNRVIVSDTGVGMSRDFIENKIFHPFSQEHNELTNNYAGSGLGLSIVKSLIDMMGAVISVESELGVGTKFTIDIDFECVSENYVQQMAGFQEEGKEAIIEKLYGSHVLLAEDHPLNAEIAQKLLQKAGCDVVWVKNGLECVNIFTESAPHQFDIILMDIRMPIMDGLSAAKAIRMSSHPCAKSIPIIAMTANAYKEDIKESSDAGMNEHLAKPIDPQKFYAVLAKYAAKRT